MHDTQRQTSQGDSSFRDVVRGLRLLSNYGVEWNAMATVNAANVEPPLVFYRFFRDELECRHLQFIPVVERMGNWKMISKGGIPHLYNLADDLHEDHDIASVHPDIVRQMVEIAHREHTDCPHFKVTMPRLE